jgi:hypothetical protein
MTILTHEIKARTKHNLLAVACESDFCLGPGVGSINLNELVSRSSVSLYCIDPISGNVLLTETPEALDIADSTFVYEAQYRCALRVHSAPLNDLLAAAQELSLPANTLFLHSTGRCGSTLLAKALAGSGVVTFSEPDIFTQLALLGRPSQQKDIAAIQVLYECFVRFFARGRNGPLAFKLRSTSCEHADYIAAALPSAKSLFLYRDAVSVARSYARVTGRKLESWHLSSEERQAWSVLVSILRERSNPVSGYDLMAALWAGPVVRYLESYDSGIWLGAINFTDLLTDPTRLLAWLLGALGLEREIEVPTTFEAHSQEGSHLDPQSAVLDPELERELNSPLFVEQVVRSLQAFNPMLSPDMVLPNG